MGTPAQRWVFSVPIMASSFPGPVFPGLFSRAMTVSVGVRYTRAYPNYFAKKGDEKALRDGLEFPTQPKSRSPPPQCLEIRHWLFRGRARFSRWQRCQGPEVHGDLHPWGWNLSSRLPAESRAAEPAEYRAAPEFASSRHWLPCPRLAGLSRRGDPAVFDHSHF